MEAHPNLDAAREMLTAIGMRKPIYLYDRNQPSSNQRPLSEVELQHYTGRMSVLAVTSPVMDLKLRSNALRYEHNGRGFCCMYWRAVASRTESQVLATTLHEYAHWMADVGVSARDDRNYARAISQWHNCTDSAALVGHGERWLRCSVSVWQRALSAGFSVDFDDVVDAEQYGFSDQQVSDAMAEALRRRDKPLETLELLLTLPKESPKAPAINLVAASTNAEPKLVSGDGECVWLYPDGHVESEAVFTGSVGAFDGTHDRPSKSYKSMTSYWQTKESERQRSLNAWRQANASPFSVQR